MPEAMLDLDQWLTRVRKAKTRQEVFKVLEEFRVLAWSDEQRAAMARVYVRLLEGMKPADDDKDESSPSGQEAADGPVWYEKM